MQCSPSQPGWQTHCPSLHSPCSSQVGWHACLSQVVPSHPSSHWQRPATHTLWVLQGTGQTSEMSHKVTERKYICYHSLSSTTFLFTLHLLHHRGHLLDAWITMFTNSCCFTSKLFLFCFVSFLHLILNIQYMDILEFNPNDFLCCWRFMLVHSWLLHCTMTGKLRALFLLCLCLVWSCVHTLHLTSQCFDQWHGCCRSSRFVSSLQ